VPNPFSPLLTLLASQAQSIPFLPVEQPKARSRVKCQGRASHLKQNTIARLFSLDVYPGVGYLCCTGE